MGVVERQQGLPKERKTEDGVDLHAEVGGQRAAVVDEGLDVIEPRAVELEAAQHGRREQGGVALG